MTAPLASKDYSESPYKLIAITLAYTSLPHGNEQGDTIRVATGIVQVVKTDYDISQFVKSIV